MVVCECGHDEQSHYALAEGGHACGFCDCRELRLSGEDIDVHGLVETHARAAELLQADDAEIALRFDRDAGSFQAVLRRAQNGAQNGAVAVGVGATVLAALQTLAQQLG